jgi:Septum formation
MDQQAPPPPPPPYTTPPPPYTPMPQQPPVRRRSPLITIVIIGVIAVFLIVAVYFALGRKDVKELAVGDCFNEPTNISEVSDVEHHACTEPHDNEVVAVLTDTTPAGQPFPGDSYFRTQLGERCGPAVTAYIGTDVMVQNVLDFGVFFPNEDGWGRGDRGLTCYVYRVDRAKLTSSVKGAVPPS